MSGLFENLASTDDSLIIAHRVATRVATKRVRDRFGAFLANADRDLSARLALVEDDIAEIVQDVVAEHGGDAQKIEAAIKRSLQPQQSGGGLMPGGPPGAPPSIPPSATGMLSPGAPGVPPGAPPGAPGQQPGAPPPNGGLGANPGSMAEGPPQGGPSMLQPMPGQAPGPGVDPAMQQKLQEMQQQNPGMGNPLSMIGALRRAMMPAGVAGGTPGAGGVGGATCPQCGGPMVNGQCSKCQAGAAAAGHVSPTIPQSPATGPIQARVAAGGFCDDCKNWKSGPKAGCKCGDSDKPKDESDDDSKDTHEPDHDKDEADDKPDFFGKDAGARVARRPKMCPYHSEVVDVALGSGDPQAGFNAMSQHAWGDNHCKGGFEGACNFKPAMVTQTYWDGKQNEYAERAEQRALAVPELSIDTEPIMHAEPLPDEPGEEGVTDIDGELENAPSAVGAGEMAMAASTRRSEALKTEKLPTGDNTGLGGPSPKIDKGPSGDQGGWNLDPIDTEMDGSPNPVEKQYPTDKADFNKEDFLAQTDANVTSETLPTNKGDAGYNTERNIKQYPTKTFGDSGHQAKPVTQTALSAVDPDKNPIRELMEEYSGFLMPNQVQAAVTDWEVG